VCVLFLHRAGRCAYQLFSSYNPLLQLTCQILPLGADNVMPYICFRQSTQSPPASALLSGTHHSCAHKLGTSSCLFPRTICLNFSVDVTMFAFYKVCARVLSARGPIWASYVISPCRWTEIYENVGASGLCRS
jgi:hypothetical protein